MGDMASKVDLQYIAHGPIWTCSRIWSRERKKDKHKILVLP
jgi:hypothetical protein